MPNNCEGDQLLVDALHNGHENAITNIYHKHGKKLLATAYNHLKDATEAENIVLKILTELWDDSALLEIDSLTGYLDTALKHAIFRAISRQKQTAVILLRD
jgi:DNA-directed RNA polymerase specialized sigma24 family protein